MDLNKELEEFNSTLREIEVQNARLKISILLIPFIIGIFWFFIIRNRIKTLTVLRDKTLQDLECRVTESVREAELLLAQIEGSDTNLPYFKRSDYEKCLSGYLCAYEPIRERSDLFPDAFNHRVNECLSRIEGIEQQVRLINAQFVERLLQDSERRVDKIILEMGSLLAQIKARDTYLTYVMLSDYERILSEQLQTCDHILTWSDLFSDTFVRKTEAARLWVMEIQKYIREFNTHFVERRLQEYDYLFEKAPYPLDRDQKRAVIIDDKHNLIVAGAGSGKTEVLITRIAYLIDRKPDTIHPDRILALAYQNKAASEMRDRLYERFGVEVKIKTFHAFGKEIVEKAYLDANRAVPRLQFSGDNSEHRYNQFIATLYVEGLKSEDFQRLVTRYMEYYDDAEVLQNEVDFEERMDFYEYMRGLTYTALNGVVVKSEAERNILNFLLTHAINGEEISVEYEQPAEWMRYVNEDGRISIPKPDFYLPQYRLYIEHWAVDENGRVPDWFEGEDPSAAYQKGMALKKERFASQDEYGLVETCHWELRNTSVGEVLSKKLLQALHDRNPDTSFEITPLPYPNIYDKVWKECRDSIDSLRGQIANFITIAKTYDLTPDEIERRLQDELWSSRQLAFAGVALKIYRDYEQHLRSNDFIDFSDMINLAVRALHDNDGLYRDTFDHILVDEYQDISAQRYKLIKALMDKNPACKLFCVGDDWQSIMGFAGSNVDYFVRFSDYFAHPQRTDLTVNYRSCASIVKTGAAIIRHNDDVQLKKEIVAFDQSETVAVWVIAAREQNAYRYYRQVAHHCVDYIESLLNDGYLPGEIMVLSRILNRPLLRDEILRYARSKDVPISTETQKFNSVPFMSVHKSKGLQARVVIVLSVDKGPYGFPCELQNPDIYDPAVKGRRKDREEEERRLFYVAVTRGKETVVLYTQESSMSKFIKEISEHVQMVKL
jgi:DNA helicase-4